MKQSRSMASSNVASSGSARRASIARCFTVSVGMATFYHAPSTGGLVCSPALQPIAVGDLDRVLDLESSTLRRCGGRQENGGPSSTGLTRNLRFIQKLKHELATHAARLQSGLINKNGNGRLPTRSVSVAANRGRTGPDTC